MALKALLTADEFGKLGDQFKAEYRETKAGSGKYVLDVVPSDGFALEDVSGLKSALGKERAEKEAIEKSQKAFEGMDVKEAKAALALMEDLKKHPLEDKVKAQVEAREKALTEKFGKDLSAKDTELSDYRTQLEETLVVSAATAAIAKHKGVVPLLLPHVVSQVKVEKDRAGKFVAKVVGPDGNARISLRSGSSENMGIEELVETMRSTDVFGVAFEGSKASGSGASGSNGVSGSGRTISIRDGKAMSASIDDIASGKVVVVD